MIRRDIADILAKRCQETFGIDVEPEVSFAEAKYGDFASNIALKLSKDLGRSPLEIADELTATVIHEDIASAESVPPGFINITMSDDYWRRYLSGIDENYLQAENEQGKKVQVEFISANPTGPLTLGNARGGFIGDVISNVLDSSGYEVTREYYFNDAGTQVTKLLESVKAEAGLLDVEDRQYSGPYIGQLAEEFKSELLDSNDDDLKKILTQAIFERYIKPDIDKMGIGFDVWFNETELIEDGTFAKTVELLKDKQLLFERDGAVWVRTGQGGDPREERVFIKSNGDPAYFAPDVAYHVNIFQERDFDVSIKELGPDHIAQFPSVQAVIKLLFPDKEMKMVGHQQLRLVKNGEELKMSKRLGRYVTVGELIDEVGADIARFFFLMRSADTHMDFDLDLAKEQSQKNPFWYVMYAYVRANAIAREAGKKGVEPGDRLGEFESTERDLVRQLAYLPELIDQIAENYEVHRLTYWGRETARLFHEWYETVRVLDLPDDKASRKLYMLDRFMAAMRAYFGLLGIEPYEKM